MLHFFYNNFTNLVEEKHNIHVSHRYRKITSKMLHFFFYKNFTNLEEEKHKISHSYRIIL